MIYAHLKMYGFQTTRVFSDKILFFSQRNLWIIRQVQVLNRNLIRETGWKIKKSALPTPLDYCSFVIKGQYM